MRVCFGVRGVRVSSRNVLIWMCSGQRLNNFVPNCRNLSKWPFLGGDVIEHSFPRNRRLRLNETNGFSKLPKQIVKRIYLSLALSLSLTLTRHFASNFTYLPKIALNVYDLLHNCQKKSCLIYPFEKTVQIFIYKKSKKIIQSINEYN